MKCGKAKCFLIGRKFLIMNQTMNIFPMLNNNQSHANQQVKACRSKSVNDKIGNR